MLIYEIIGISANMISLVDNYNLLSPSSAYLRAIVAPDKPAPTMIIGCLSFVLITIYPFLCYPNKDFYINIITYLHM